MAIDQLEGQSEADTTCRAIKEMDPAPSKVDFADSMGTPQKCCAIFSGARPTPFPVFPRTMRLSTPPAILDLGRRMRRDRGRLERLIHSAL